MSKDIKTLLREAAEEVGFVQRVPVLDAAGEPTGQTELRYGKDDEAGYLRWLAINHPGYYASLYGRLIRHRPAAGEHVERAPLNTVVSDWNISPRSGPEGTADPPFARNQARDKPVPSPSSADIHPADRACKLERGC
jgi:hypothetical protein